MTADDTGQELDTSLGELFDAAQNACDEGVGTLDFEPAFIRLLEFVEHHPECRASAERRFLDGLSSGAVCWELVSFCMHSLRMQAVKNEVQRLLDESPDPRLMAPLSHILASFEDDWEDADLYVYYRDRP